MGQLKFGEKKSGTELKQKWDYANNSYFSLYPISLAVSAA